MRDLRQELEDPQQPIAAQRGLPRGEEQPGHHVPGLRIRHLQGQHEDPHAHPRAAHVLVRRVREAAQVKVLAQRSPEAAHGGESVQVLATLS